MPLSLRPPRSGRPPSAGSAQQSERLRAELDARSRSSGLIIVSVVTLAFPAWGVLDHVLEPDHASAFLVLRLLTEIPVVVCLWSLWGRPSGRRHSTLLTFLVLALVQVDIAAMLVRAEHVEFYLLGFSLPLYGSGVLLAARPRWTGALVGATGLALAVAILTDPTPVRGDTLSAVIVFMATASLVALIAHSRRWQLGVRELGVRIRLEDEQRRTDELVVQLDRLSHEDALTGLANRRRWDGELAEVCARAQQDGGRLAVVLLDLDRFKQVNDEFGHAAGDSALRSVATLLRQRIRAGDLAARLGGDELAVLLPGAGLTEAVGFAERVRAESMGLWPENYARPGVSLSIGVAVADGPGARPTELLSAADAQLYLAKASRNTVCAPAIC